MTEPKEYEATLIDRGNGDGYLIVHCKPMEVQFKVKAFPDMSMEIERPHGEWIEKKGGVPTLYHYCSVCNEAIRINDFNNFCPNCGASMQTTDENTQKHYGFRKKY